MAIKPLSKSELRHIGDAIRDFIWVGSKPLPKVEYLPEPEEGECKWYVVMTNPRCEHRAQSGLIEKGFGAYLPQYKLEKIVKRTKERKIVNRSLFPRYMFVRAPEGSWTRITSTDGVECLVRSTLGKPVSVAGEAIEKLLDRQNSGAFDELKGEAGPVQKGDLVRVVRGAFFTFEATVAKVFNGKHVDIMVDLFGKPHTVRVPVDHVESL